MRKFLLSPIISLLLFTNLFAQENILRDLLDLPSPPPKNREVENDENHRVRSPEFFDDKNVPSDDAPIEDVLDYWQRKSFSWNPLQNNQSKISEKNSLRLLEHLSKESSDLPEFLNIFPNDEKTAGKIKEIFDFSQDAENISDSWKEKVKGWLSFNSKFYVDELISSLAEIKDNKEYGSVDKQDELEALTKIDWEKAEPILRRLETDTNNPRSSALALTLLYKKAIEEKDNGEIEKYRGKLKEILLNRNSPALAGDMASDALFETEWQGQEEFYLSLMEDSSLLFPREKNTVYSPLTTLPAKNPDKWIPILAKLVGNKNRAVHNAAVQSLMEFENRKDALEPLLPWLTNPDWADINWSPGGRTTYMQIVSNVDLPESIPGLIWIVENDKEEAHWAANSLAKYKDERAVPALKNAIERTPEIYRQDFIRALIACNGLTVDEQFSALEFYAEFISSPEGKEKVEKRGYYDDENPLPSQISIGKYLSKDTEPSEGFILRTIERQKILQKEKPKVAKIFSEIMSGWKGRAVDLEMLRKISERVADVETIVGALARRKELRENIPDALLLMRGKSGSEGAFAACLIEDENDILSAFHSTDAETQIGVLACARLLRKPLPVREVGMLLDSKNKMLALAAERYLESEDSLEAREMIWAKHPNEAVILGARTSFNPAKISEDFDYQSPLGRLFLSVSNVFSFQRKFPEIEKSEKKLREEILQNPELKNIYAILPEFEWGQMIVRVYKTRATLTYIDDVSRYKEKNISKEELEKLLKTLDEININEFRAKSVDCHHNCYVREFLTLSQKGGRRIYAGSGFGALESLDELGNFFQSEKFVTRYNLQSKISGLEILFADERFQPQIIWKNGSDFRILIANKEKEELIRDEINEQNEIEDKNKDLSYKTKSSNAFKRRAEREFEHYEWREFKNGKLGEKVDEPSEILYLREKLSFPSLENTKSNDGIWKSRFENYEIRVGERDEVGLWKVNRGEKIPFKDGNYSEPIVGENWLVVAKAKESWAEPNDVVRINMQTGKETKINLPSAGEFYPIAFVPTHRKFILYRSEYAYSTLNPKPAEYYLLDAATGKTESVKGEFQPLINQSFRSLQSAGKPNEFWATVYSRAKNQTEVGIYNTQNFTFKPILNLPEILLSSTDIWVDDKDGKIYFIYGDDFGRENHLLSIPLPERKTTANIGKIPFGNSKVP